MNDVWRTLTNEAVEDIWSDVYPTEDMIEEAKITTLWDAKRRLAPAIADLKLRLTQLESENDSLRRQLGAREMK